MGSLSVWHWLIFLAIVLIFFGGKGKISDLMGDFAKGIKSFKKGMQDEDEAKKPADPNAPQAAPKVIEGTKVPEPQAAGQPAAAPSQPGKAV